MHADVFAMPDRVAGIPAFLLEGVDGKRDLFMSVIGRIGEGFFFALIPEGPPQDGLPFL